ncbi:germination protein YpeB [Halalkalibacter hemicellulosilyticus]|uniref:Spore germination protein YpeB n=1 Tax=Halalkalibacter hemicellulosilyticusJCM 9152 TaxID=1236971 RepID=W4QAG0_9BACI|nr:germination protein YpeB [Halalkalibacter hemicellulosilyticus]GAE28995.1 spore germination protein YpeB [Halalkalibacter hemicellulosilyticusJCM 9152]
MAKNLIIGLLAIALVSTGIWGYQQQTQGQTLQIQAENNYQRAFHELAYYIDQIEDQLGASLAMNTRRQLTPALAEIWRVTSLAHEMIGQLPLNFVDIGKTEEFLFKMGRFSYRTSIRDLDKDPLTDEEYETLEKLYDYSKEIRQELRKAQALMLQQDGRWLDVEQALEQTEEAKENEVVTNFEVMNKAIEGYSETDWGVSLAAIDDLNGELKRALEEGEEISEAEAKDKALSFLNMNEQTEVDISKTGNGLEYPAYSIVINDPNHGSNYYMDMSVYGGEPLWFLQDRQVSETNKSLNEAAEAGSKFLKKQDKPSMQLVDSKQYNSLAVLEYVHLEDNVRVYPDQITLEVALDDNDILGYHAISYLINHKERDIPDPEISMEEALDNVNPRLEIMEDHIAVIENDLGEEVLCYEFFGVIDNDTYRIFINAEDGEEEKVEMLEQAEPVYDFS